MGNLSAAPGLQLRKDRFALCTFHLQLTIFLISLVLIMAHVLVPVSLRQVSQLTIFYDDT